VKPSSAWKLAFPSSTKRAVAKKYTGRDHAIQLRHSAGDLMRSAFIGIGKSARVKSRVFTRHDGTAGVWSADIR
jgi:hypothetical protein